VRIEGIEKLEFPITLRNLQSVWQSLGGIWVPPSGCISVSRIAFERSKEQIAWAVEAGRVSIVEIEEQRSPRDEPEDTPAEEAGESVIKRFAEKKIHWRVAQKEIEAITDIDELDQLLSDAKYYDLPDDSVLVKAINERIDKLIDGE
jgi:hypothetical protein